MGQESHDRRLRGRLLPASLLAAVLLLALAWAAPRAWDYVEYRRCVRSTCPPPSAVEVPIRLASGTSLPVIGYVRSGDGQVTIDYVTQQDARQIGDLCREAREVWAALRDSERVKGASEVNLGPTSAKPEYFGALGCLCRNVYLTVRRNQAGDWQFWQTSCANY